MRTKLTAQAKKSLAKKQMIYDITMQLFREYGYDGTSIKDICAAAGITSGTFYNYFGDKCGILREFHHRMATDRLDLLEPTAEHLASPFQSICTYYVESIIDPQDQIGKNLSRDIMHHLNPVFSSGTLTEQTANSYPYIEIFLNEAINAGTLPKNTNIKLISEYLRSSLYGLINYWHHRSRDDKMRDVAKRLFPLIFSAITDESIVV